MTRRLRHVEGEVHHVDGFERANHVVVDACLREEEADLRSSLGGLVEKRFHEDPRVTASAHGGFGADGAYPADARRPPVEYSREVVLLCSSEEGLVFNKGERTLITASPRRFHSGRVTLTVCQPIQAITQGPTPHVERTLENGSLRVHQRRRVISISASPHGLAICRPI